jgi:hypothetical protein
MVFNATFNNIVDLPLIWWLIIIQPVLSLKTRDTYIFLPYLGLYNAQDFAQIL